MSEATKNSQAEPHALRVLCRTGDMLGEGPLWDHRTGSLLWIDILQGRVHSWSISGGVLRDILQMDAMIGSIALAGAADLVLATSKGIYRRYATTGEIRLLANPLQNRPLRFNDGRVDALGRFWVGTMALDAAHYGDPWGELYRFDPDGSLHRMEQGLTISNGLDWSPDGRTFYLTDTMRRIIYAYDFDVVTGSISNRRIFTQSAESHGYPDGLVVDRSGNIWSAGFGGGVICCYDSRGHCIGRISMPVSCPTSLAFGGDEDYSTAFVTTSRHVLPADQSEPDAGAVFSIGLEPSVQGRRAAIFEIGAHR